MERSTALAFDNNKNNNSSLELTRLTRDLITRPGKKRNKKKRKSKRKCGLGHPSALQTHPMLCPLETLCLQWQYVKMVATELGTVTTFFVYLFVWCFDRVR